MEDKKAITQWKKSNVSFENYQKYIARKSNRFQLDLIDLLYISNFKGGNATINEGEDEISRKLLAYSEKLKQIHSEFGDRALADLSEEELIRLEEVLVDVCALTQRGSDAKIDGFSVSYLSALLCAHFPKLIPILDRRVLINMELVKKTNLDSMGQVKEIVKFYGPLINEMYEKSKAEGKGIREIDQKYFTRKLKITTVKTKPKSAS